MSVAELVVCPRCGELGRERIYEVRGHLYRFVYHGGSRCYLGPVKPIYRASAPLRPLEPVTRVQIPAGAPTVFKKEEDFSSVKFSQILTNGGGQLITTVDTNELGMSVVERAAELAAVYVARYILGKHIPLPWELQKQSAVVWDEEVRVALQL